MGSPSLSEFGIFCRQVSLKKWGLVLANLSITDLNGKDLKSSVTIAPRNCCQLIINDDIC
jgi:hypothetical protein